MCNDEHWDVTMYIYIVRIHIQKNFKCKQDRINSTCNSFMSARNISRFYLLFLWLLSCLSACCNNYICDFARNIQFVKKKIMCFLCCGDISHRKLIRWLKVTQLCRDHCFPRVLRALMSLSAHGEKASIFYLQSPRATELNVEIRGAFIMFIARKHISSWLYLLVFLIS